MAISVAPHLLGLPCNHFNAYEVINGKMQSNFTVIIFYHSCVFLLKKCQGKEFILQDAINDCSLVHYLNTAFDK